MPDSMTFDAGPYEDEAAAEAMAASGVYDPKLAASPEHIRWRRPVLIETALRRSGADDWTPFEGGCIEAIAAQLSVAETQVIAGWIYRAYRAGQLSIMANGGA